MSAAIASQAPTDRVAGPVDPTPTGTVSLLAPDGVPGPLCSLPPPAVADLRLEPLIEATGPSPLQRSIWWTPLADRAVVQFRQAIVAELHVPDVRAAASEFTAAMTASRTAIAAAAASHYPLCAELGLLEAVLTFTAAVRRFRQRLAALRPQSAGLVGLEGYLAGYVAGPSFTSLARASRELADELRAPTFEVGVQAGTVWVAPEGSRSAWAGDVAAAFARFAEENQAAPALVPPRPRRQVNHVEEQALVLVAQLMPGPFERLHRFATDRGSFLPEDLERLGEELGFYLGFIALVGELGRRMDWCLPTVEVGPSGPVRMTGLVDPALALRSESADARLVANDLALAASERIAFVTGPNQGGKTTLARAVGAAAYLCSLGLPVPARTASLPLLSPVLTHFPSADDPANERGGLADELARLHDVLERTDGNTLLVFNELFAATSAHDALQLAALVLQRVERVGCRVLWVTFLEDLVTSLPGAASLVGGVAADDPTRPTFTFRARPPDGRSHAAALAARHGLSAQDLAGRLP